MLLNFVKCRKTNSKTNKVKPHKFLRQGRIMFLPTCTVRDSKKSKFIKE